MKPITNQDVQNVLALFNRNNVEFQWKNGMRGYYGCITKWKRSHKAATSYLVEVRNNLPNYIKVAVLAHEHGHYLCDIKSCRCGGVKGRLYSDNTIGGDHILLTEAHAYIYELNYLMEKKLWKSLKWALTIFNIKYDPVIVEVSKYVKRSKAYKTAKKLTSKRHLP